MLHPAITPAPQDQPWFPTADWLARHEQLVRDRPARVDLLFVGDSITEGWLSDGRSTWDREYAPRHACNLGIGGDETAHVLWRLAHGAVDGLAPKRVVLLIGTNNLGNVGPTRRPRPRPGWRPSWPTSGGGCRVARSCCWPSSPRDRFAGDPFRRAVAELNALIRPLADGSNVRWLDVGPALVRPDGSISPAIMPDFLHLSPAGYQAWADTMRPALADRPAEIFP